MKPKILAPLVLVVLAVASCSSDAPNTTSPGSTSTSLAAETSTSSASAPSSTVPATTSTSTSTTTSTTSTTSTTTSTTVAPGAELVLRPNGLGDAAFGAEPEGVVAYVTAIIGGPTVDTGWVEPLSVGACPGTEFRQVFWGDLVLQFSDISNITNGRRHFFSYQYGPAFVQGSITPAGLKTDAGIGVGSTVAELTGTYPTAVINPGSDLGGPNFLVNDNLAGFLTGVTPADTVTSILGGQGCGE